MPQLKDYYKRTISFLLFPVGIFWIQNEIIQLGKQETSHSKIRGSVLIGATLLMSIVTAASVSNSELHFNIGGQNSHEWMDDSTAILKVQQHYDSLFKSMDDSAKAAFIFKESINQYNSGNYRKAINYLNSSILLDSLNSLYYYNRGVILSEQFNQLDSAIIDMSIAIDLEPTDWRAYLNRSNCHFLLGKFDLALADIDKALNFNEEESNSYLLRGMIKEHLIDTNGACLDFKKADSLGNANAYIKMLNACY
jgi:tetratricopeptide (TPR) repeat protein